LAGPSAHCVAAGIAPTSPSGNVVETPEKYWLPSPRSRVKVNEVWAPAWLVWLAVACLGAKAGGEAHAPPLPSASTVKGLLSGLAAGLPL
jgi:hypothetical protein